VIERVRFAGAARRRVPRDEHRAAQALVSAASATAFLLRSHDRCMVRGLAFHASCRKTGLNTKLVLGVIAHPFTAHCWVQLGNVVLVGGYEQARLYTPILVLE
jgi:transglutaminase superfamily protein